MDGIAINVLPLFSDFIPAMQNNTRNLDLDLDFNVNRWGV